MQKTLAELAKLVDGEVVGDKKLIITGLSGIKEAKEGDLTFIANSKYTPLIKTTKASAILIPRDLKVSGKSIIRTDNPSLAFANIASLTAVQEEHPFQGIDKSAVIAKDAILGENVSIGPLVVIEKKAHIGENTVIYPGCYVGYKTFIGKDCLIYPNVSIRDHITIGNRVIIHSGTVIGSDGFGYDQVDGRHKKIPQTGTVLIEDDVELGANVTVDRARFDKTIIGRGTKIDNLVQVAHNVVIGENCIIISQVGISGSVTIGKNVILAGQVGVAGHLTIGEGSVVVAQSCVTKSLPPFSKVSGFPAKPHIHAKRVNAALQRLPMYVKKIQELEKKIKELEGKLKKKK